MKKNSIIRQFIFDDPYFWEKGILTEEQKRLMGVLSDLEDEIGNKFKGDKKTLELFKKYTNALDDLNLEESSLLFEKAVKFGVLFGMELSQE